MLLKKDVERCFILAHNLCCMYKRRDDAEMRNYYLGVYHACETFLGKKTDLSFVENMEEEIEYLKNNK